MIEFTIPGRITSANLVTRNLAMIVAGKARGRSLKSKSAHEDTERIRALAFAAKIAKGWVVPVRAAISIFAFGSAIDADNISKVITDSVKGGLLIVDDRPKHLRSLYVEHQERDAGGERYVVRVRALDEVSANFDEG